MLAEFLELKNDAAVRKIIGIEKIE
jgi:hypothetical protein